MNLSRTQAAWSLLFVGLLFATALALRADYPLAHRLVLGAVFVGVLMGMRWIAYEMMEEEA